MHNVQFIVSLSWHQLIAVTPFERLANYFLYVFDLHLQVHLLLKYQAKPTIHNKEFKTPLDLACEFGRYRVRYVKKLFNEKYR